MTQMFKVVVTVPQEHAGLLREAIAKEGGGTIGNYTHCSFSLLGVGRFKPQQGAQPHLGQLNQLEEVMEERLEISCSQNNLKAVVKAIRKAHPYEEPVIDVYALMELDQE